jgi:nucleoside-diphosphate-sugar epimerase
MSNILIIGGGGYLGSHLARLLLSNDYNVVIMDLKMNRKLFKDVLRRAVIVKGDVTNAKQLKKVLRRRRVDAVVHYAALLSSTTESNPSLGYRVNFDGVWNVWDAARAAEVDMVIFASSIAAYGSGITYEARENTYTIPETLYGISKQFGEMIGSWFLRKYGIQFAAFRYGSVIGPGRRNGGASAYSTLIVQKPAQGKPCEVWVRKKDTIPVAYVKDATAVTMSAYQNVRRLRSRIYNVASLKRSPTAEELAKSVKKHVPNAKIVFKPDPVAVRIIESWPKNLDTTTVQRELSWKPRYRNLDLIVADFVREVREHPDMFYV